MFLAVLAFVVVVVGGVNFVVVVVLFCSFRQHSVLHYLALLILIEMHRGWVHVMLFGLPWLLHNAGIQVSNPDNLCITGQSQSIHRLVTCISFKTLSG